MQRPERPAATTNAFWKPVGDEDKQRLQECLLDLLPEQTNPEPSFTLLAMIGATPRSCENATEEAGTTQVAMGELRAPLIRWLRTTPQSCLTRAIKTVLRIPELPHPNLQAMQEGARRLQQALGEQTTAGPVEALQGHWRDTSDVGIVEELLQLLAGANGEQACRKTRPSRPSLPCQTTLQQAWGSLSNRSRAAG